MLNITTWDNKFNALAAYNAEKSRGIVHNEEYCQRMAVLQAEFNARVDIKIDNGNISICSTCAKNYSCYVQAMTKKKILSCIQYENSKKILDT